MDFRTATEDELRGFLRLCLAPRPGMERTPEELARLITAGPLRDNLERHAPQLGALRTAADRAAAAYVEALTAWIRSDGGPGLCTQNGRGDKAEPQPHTFPAVDGGPSRCLWCAVPAEGIAPGYRTRDGREWSLAAVSTEDGLPLYEAPFVGARYTADGLALLHGELEPLTAVEAPAYVHNARSVNRRPGTAVKHIPDGHGATICPRGFQASKPMPVEEAALLPLCNGCRDAAVARAESPTYPDVTFADLP